MLDLDVFSNVIVFILIIFFLMAVILQYSQFSDLSSIVYQINQFCQTRVGISIILVCEGQIVNFSFISRSLFINVSIRVSIYSVFILMFLCVVNFMEYIYAVIVVLFVAGFVNLFTGIFRVFIGYFSDFKLVVWNQYQLVYL